MLENLVPDYLVKFLGVVNVIINICECKFEVILTVHRR